MKFDGLAVGNNCLIAVFKNGKEPVYYMENGLRWILSEFKLDPDDLKEYQKGLRALETTNIKFK